MPAVKNAGGAEDVETFPLSHWSYQPIERPEPPQVRDARWGHSPIDRFVLAKLESVGLAPSSPADRRTLVRRAYFDLIGLPPIFQEVQAFADDESPDAFAQVVDGLLDRNEYGQRWGRHWLDVARYADTTGYLEGAEFRYPFSYAYRDYVIRSFNEDTPYDRFVIEQLAADQLDLGPDERWKLAGMGFLTVGSRFNYNLHEVIDDRIDVIMRGFMGLTVGCARCHDHKYDPIVSDDYYGLYGVLASSTEPLCSDLPRLEESRGQFSRYRKFREAIRKPERRLKSFLAKTYAEIQHEMRAFAGDYLHYLVQSMPEHRTQTQVSFDTGRVHLRGPTPYGPGGIVRWQHYVDSRGDDDAVFGPWNRLARLSRSEFYLRAAEILDSCSDINPLLRSNLYERAPLSMVDVADVYGDLLESTYQDWLQLQQRDPGAPALSDPAAEQLRQTLFADDSPVAMTPEESLELCADGEFNRYMGLKRELESVFIEYRDVAAARAMVLVDRPIPYKPRVFLRGNSTRPGAFVPRRFVRFLSRGDGAEPFAHGSGRLELARAIVSRDNPLAARVIVNRVWHWHFGAGLVDTPSDFGTRGGRPSHPGLLDYLARRLMDGGWSLKTLHREIMLSATYQQSSQDRLRAHAVDPENRFLWRMNRRRLEWEAFRDSLLAVSGRLDHRLGGYPEDRLSSQRRSVYLFIDRQGLPGAFGTFDFPSPDISSPSRAETTVPQQALYVMNNAYVIDTARQLAEDLLVSLPNQRRWRQRVDWLHRQALGRRATDEEVELARGLFAAQKDDGGRLSMPVDGLWQQFAHAILMSNEFMFVD